MGDQRLPARADGGHPSYGKLGDLTAASASSRARSCCSWSARRCADSRRSMTELIAFRAVQGLGAGGLIVLSRRSSATSSRRGNGVATRACSARSSALRASPGRCWAGCSSRVSWRWIFYVNLPVGLVALAVIGSRCPARVGGGRRSTTSAQRCWPRGLSAIVLVTSLGGTSWAGAGAGDRCRHARRGAARRVRVPSGEPRAGPAVVLLRDRRVRSSPGSLSRSSALRCSARSRSCRFTSRPSTPRRPTGPGCASCR